MRTTLYDIADDYRNFLAMIESGEIEDQQVIADTLDSIQQSFDAKLDSIACIIKELSAGADAIEAEVKRLLERERIKRNAVDRLKRYVAAQMMSIGQDKFENERNQISFRSSTSLHIVDEKALLTSLQVAGRDDLYSIEETVTLDKKNIKKAIKDGEALAGCEVVTNKNIQIR